MTLRRLAAGDTVTTSAEDGGEHRSVQLLQLRCSVVVCMALCCGGSVDVVSKKVPTNRENVEFATKIATFGGDRPVF